MTEANSWERRPATPPRALSVQAGQNAELASSRLVIATGNPHKIGEMRAILAPLLPGIDLRSVASLDDFGFASPIEDGVTFAENALIKARDLAARTGMAALADDSGLSVDVLGGSPGVFSARWSGRHGDDTANRELLLLQLADVPAARRKARFVCAAALVLPDGQEFVEEGVVDGMLATSPRGTGGFGYDPIFIPAGYDQTTAELGPETKNRISHRAAALRALAPHLEEILR